VMSMRIVTVMKMPAGRGAGGYEDTGVMSRVRCLLMHISYSQNVMRYGLTGRCVCVVHIHHIVRFVSSHSSFPPPLSRFSPTLRSSRPPVPFPLDSPLFTPSWVELVSPWVSENLSRYGPIARARYGGGVPCI